jgi:hypothetical protein
VRGYDDVRGGAGNKGREKEKREHEGWKLSFHNFFLSQERMRAISTPKRA